ncbi:hypothetical protein BgiBS90_026087, partial [Biomphalaria glabrata]
MGRRLMDLKDSNKVKVFEEDGKHYKGMGGVKRLTQATILRIQGHYGGAIRNNTNNLLQMKKAIWAIWKHRCGDHSDCGHWCPKEQIISVANKKKTPQNITDAMKPIFEELTSVARLQKCLHGGTQNASKSFHNLI